MKRGMIAFVVVVVVAVAACKGGGAKKRVPGGEPASAARLIKTIEAVRGMEGGHGLLSLAEGVTEECGKGCDCLKLAISEEAGNKDAALYQCPSICTAEARAKAAAAAPGSRLAALAGACTPEAIGLTADSVKNVGDDWLAAFVAGQYLADAYDAANADDKKAYETAFNGFAVPLAPTAGMAGVALVAATNMEPLAQNHTFVTIDGKGAIRTGTAHAARFSPTGAALVPAELTAMADTNALRAHLAKQTAVNDEPPPPEPEPVEDEAEADGPVEDEPGGTGTAMALEEGKMGKKDSDRAEGQYHMKNNNADPQLARQQAIEAARKAGILGTINQQPGGAFAQITGTGDLNGAFDDRDIYGGLLGPDYTIVGVTSTRIRDQAVVIADKDAPAISLLQTMYAIPDGSVLAVEHKGGIAVLPFVFTELGFGFAALPDHGDGPPVDLRVELGAGIYRVGNNITNDYAQVDATDAAALQAAIKKQLDEPLFSDRRDVKVILANDSKLAQVVPALDAALSAGARSVRVESPATGETVGTFGTIGHGSGTSFGRPADATGPQVRLGQPAASGDLDKAIIRRYIKRQLPKIQYCYEKQLLTKPKLEGTVTTQFFIKPDGIVATAQASGVDPEVSSCVANVIRTIVFPKPKGGGGVQVNYPFTFRSVE